MIFIAILIEEAPLWTEFTLISCTNRCPKIVCGGKTFCCEHYLYIWICFAHFLTVWSIVCECQQPSGLVRCWRGRQHGCHIRLFCCFLLQMRGCCVRFTFECVFASLLSLFFLQLQFWCFVAHQIPILRFYTHTNPKISTFVLTRSEKVANEK